MASPTVQLNTSLRGIVFLDNTEGPVAGRLETLGGNVDRNDANDKKNTKCLIGVLGILFQARKARKHLNRERDAKTSRKTF